MVSREKVIPGIAGQVVLPGQAVQDHVKAFEGLDQPGVIVSVHLEGFYPLIADLGGQFLRSGDIVIADDDFVKIRELGQVSGCVSVFLLCAFCGSLITSRCNTLSGKVRQQ